VKNYLHNSYVIPTFLLSDGYWRFRQER